MKSLYILSFIGFLLLINGHAEAQTISLTGSVRGSDHLREIPLSWHARVIAYAAGVASPVDEDESNPDIYNLIVPQGAAVTIRFFSPGYEPKKLELDNAGSTTKRRVIPLPIVLTKLSELIKKTGGIERAIKSNVDFAKESGDINGAIYNLKIIKSESVGDAATLQKVNAAESEIKATQQNPFPDRLELRWKSFEEMLKINKNPQLVPSPEYQNLLDILKDDSLSKGIRHEAVQALSKINLPNDVKDEVLTYFRQQAQDSSSALFYSSLYGLAKLGNNADKDFVIKGAASANFERAIASVEAIGETNLKEGMATIQSLANDKQSDPILRQEAISSLENFANKLNDISSIRNLISIFEDSSNSDQIRIQAIESLRGIKLPSNESQKVKIIAIEDPSVEIRSATIGIGTVKLSDINNVKVQ